VKAHIFGLHNLSQQYCNWTTSALVLNILPFFSVVSAVSTRDAVGPGNCGSGDFIAAETDRVGSEGSGHTTTLAVQTLRPKLADLEPPSSSEYISEFLEYQLPD
jgi:hypothetical protein